MLASPFAFYRGSAAVMATDLATTATTGLNAQIERAEFLQDKGAVDFICDRRELRAGGPSGA